MIGDARGRLHRYRWTKTSGRGRKNQIRESNRYNDRRENELEVTRILPAVRDNRNHSGQKYVWQSEPAWLHAFPRDVEWKVCKVHEKKPERRSVSISARLALAICDSNQDYQKDKSQRRKPRWQFTVF